MHMKFIHIYFNESNDLGLLTEKCPAVGFIHIIIVITHRRAQCSLVHQQDGGVIPRVYSSTVRAQKSRPSNQCVFVFSVYISTTDILVAPCFNNLLRLEAGYPALRCHNLEEAHHPPNTAGVRVQFSRFFRNHFISTLFKNRRARTARKRSSSTSIFEQHIL